MTRENWQEVARELNSIEQLARGPNSAKIARHVERVRQLIRPGRFCPSGQKPKAQGTTRRRRLWRRDPRCFWCGVATDITTTSEPDSATVEHIYHRNHPKRRQQTRRHLPDTVLACYRCNHERGAPTPTTFETCPVFKYCDRAQI